MEQKVLRTGTLVIACALILRLVSGGFFGIPHDLTLSPKIASWLIFFQTGRVVRPANIEFTPTKPTEEAPPTLPVKPEISVPTFSAADADALQINSSFSFTADLPALISKPLSWDLTEAAPTVLILHSHGSESFSGSYSETSPYHTLDTDHNMISIGARVAELLTAGGISVLHDTTLHDNPSYNASYSNSRASVQRYLQDYPTIRLVLDLHRDSFEDEEGNQIVQTVFSQGTAFAPLMLVVGTNYGGLDHPQWRENLSLALKLQTQLEALCPGICRDINLRSQRFNQDLSSGALLIEVGASGNTQQQALHAAEILAQGILSLAHGSN